MALSKMHKDILAIEWKEWDGMRAFCLDRAAQIDADYGTEESRRYVDQSNGYARDMGIIERCYAALVGCTASDAQAQLKARAAKI